MSAGLIEPTTESSNPVMLIAVVVAIAGLYFGRSVLMPLSLSLVMSFSLTPVVLFLEKWRLGRVPSVLVVLVLVAAIVTSVGGVVTVQLISIVNQLPEYKSNVHDKIQALRLPGSGGLNRARDTVTELGNELSKATEGEPNKITRKTVDQRPVPVQLESSPTSVAQFLQAVVGPIAGVFETSAMVIVFTLFMLVKRENLHNRVILLAGQGRLDVDTLALDDASRRLSRYLFLQFLVNITYGMVLGAGTYLIGVPHALLWGVLAALLRFIPYVGAPTAALFPMAMAMAVFPSWNPAILVFGLFIAIEVVAANLIEPWLYGTHIGISPLAILVAAVFWATLWGPVGLILSTPLTVCLILLGRYVPELGFLEIMLGDEAALGVLNHPGTIGRTRRSR